MNLLDKVLIAASRVFARAHRWTASAVAVSFVRNTDYETRMRLSYACILGRRSPQVQRAYQRMLRRDRDQSAAENVWLAFLAWCVGDLRFSAELNRSTAERYPGTPEAQIAAREASFTAAILDGSLRLQLASAIDRLQLNDTAGPVVLAPVSSRFLELYGLWKQQASLHLRGPVVLLGLDAQATALAGPGVQVIDLSAWFGFDSTGKIEDYSRRHLWILRVMILRELAARGHAILSLDLDAIVLGDVQAMLDALPASDLVIQRDYSIPVDVARQLGFVLCCGFFSLQPSPAVLSLLDRYVDQTIAELDDQTAINHLLAEGGLTGRTDLPTCMTFTAQGLRWALPDASLVSREVGSGAVVRHFDQKRQSLDIAGIAQAMNLTMPQ